METKINIVLCIYILQSRSFFDTHDIVAVFSEEEAKVLLDNYKTINQEAEYYTIAISETYFDNKINDIINILQVKFAGNEILRYFAELISIGFQVGKSIYLKKIIDKNCVSTFEIKSTWERFDEINSYLEMFFSEEEMGIFKWGTVINGFQITDNIPHDFMFRLTKN